MSDEVFTLLQKQSPFALTQWLADTLIDHLRTADDETHCRLISFAYAISVLRTPDDLRLVGRALASVSSTADVGIDTALLHLCRARASIGESMVSSHNTHWIRAAQILDDLPNFSVAGRRMAQTCLNRILYQNE